MTKNPQQTRLCQYQQHMLMTELEAEPGKLKLVWRSRQTQLKYALWGLLAMLAGILGVLVLDPARQDTWFTAAIIAIVLGLSGIIMGLNLYRLLKPVTLDLQQGYFFRGGKSKPLSQLCRIEVQRNTYNERFRSHMLEHLTDEELISVSVVLCFAERERLGFGLFKPQKQATDKARAYAQTLAELIGFNGEITVTQGSGLGR